MTDPDCDTDFELTTMTDAPDETPETGDETTPDSVRANTPGRDVHPEAAVIEPAAPDDFGLVQVWRGDGKGKTTVVMGMGFRAAGHGYRVHMLQLLKGGADSVEAVREEYNAIAAMPGISFESLGHYGWAGMADGSDDEDHEAQVAAGLNRTRELVDAAADADLSKPLGLNGPPRDGVHLLIIDELFYAVAMGLLDEADVLSLMERKPESLELVLTGSHDEPIYLSNTAGLVTNVRRERHPIDTGQRVRKGTKY